PPPSPTLFPYTTLFRSWSGTSAATPHVAGVAALVIARGRALGLRLTPNEVRQIIRMTADDLADRSQGEAPGWDQYTGWGRVNAFAAVSRVARGRIPPDVEITAPGWYAPERGRFVVAGPVHGRTPARWVLWLGAGGQPKRWCKIAWGAGTSHRTRPL